MVIFMKLLSSFQCSDFWLEVLKHSPMDGNNHANWLPFLEIHTQVWPSQFPVHGKRTAVPIGLNYTFQWVDAIFEQIAWSSNEKIDTVRSAK